MNLNNRLLYLSFNKSTNSKLTKNIITHTFLHTAKSIP